VQNLLPEFHISCAGRDEHEQTMLRNRGSSLADWGRSAHNFNAAIDTFVQGYDPTTIYPKDWYRVMIPSRLPPWLNWYGTPGSKFFELPHFEPVGWKRMVLSKEIKMIGLVEATKGKKND